MSAWGKDYKEDTRDKEILECPICSHSGIKEDMGHWCWPGIGLGILIMVLSELHFSGIIQDIILRFPNLIK